MAIHPFRCYVAFRTFGACEASLRAAFPRRQVDIRLRYSEHYQIFGNFAAQNS